MKIFCDARVLRSVSPALVVIALSGSSLTVMVTSPAATSFDLATIKTMTRETITRTNTATPRMTVNISAPAYN